jgi:hypothetical protein
MKLDDRLEKTAPLTYPIETTVCLLIVLLSILFRKLVDDNEFKKTTRINIISQNCNFSEKCISHRLSKINDSTT